MMGVPRSEDCSLRWHPRNVSPGSNPRRQPAMPTLLLEGKKNTEAKHVYRTGDDVRKLLLTKYGAVCEKLACWYIPAGALRGLWSNRQATLRRRFASECGAWSRSNSTNTTSCFTSTSNSTNTIQLRRLKDTCFDRIWNSQLGFHFSSSSGSTQRNFRSWKKLQRR